MIWLMSFSSLTVFTLLKIIDIFNDGPGCSIFLTVGFLVVERFKWKYKNVEFS